VSKKWREAEDRAALAALAALQGRASHEWLGIVERSGTASPTANLVTLSDIQPDRVRWLSRGRLAAGKITILDGDPGLGKSTLLCEIAARITRGEALPEGQPGEPRSVVMLSAEDDLHDTIRPRLDAAGGDPARVISFVTVPTSGGEPRPFVIPRDVPLLEIVVSRLRAALVIIDPFVAFLDRRFNASNDQDVRRALAVMKTVAERTGAAIVAVRHLNKTSAANPLYRGGGSIGIIGAARSALLLAADPEDPERRILAVSKGNLARPPAALAFRLQEVPNSDVARVVWEGESRWTAQALLAEAAQGEQERSAVDEAREWLRVALADGPRPAKEVLRAAEAAGITRNTLYAAKQAEAVRAGKSRTRHGPWVWSHDAAGKDPVGSGIPDL
jgi:hypothetical protein